MSRRIVLALLVAIIALGGFGAKATAQNKKVYYWISHGAPTDPVWVLFLQGAQKWAADTGNEVKTSFHSGDVPSHQEAIRSAIAAGAAGIVTSTPDPGSLTTVIAEAHAKGIPVIIINTEDKTSGRDAYVGGDNEVIGRRWTQYLVDKGFVKKGDAVWWTVEVTGATYKELVTTGIKRAFKQLGITVEITEATLDQAE